MKKLVFLLSLVLLNSASAGELFYTGEEFTVKVPAYDVTTIEVPCEVTSNAYPREKLQLKEVKAKDKTIVYVLPKDREATVSLSCVDRTYVFKLKPVDLRPKKKLECRNGKCQIVEVKPEADISSVDNHYVVVDPTIVREETGGRESSFASKEQIVDAAVKLMSAMVTDRKPPGYVVRKKELSYYLTPDLSVSLVRFYKGLLYGQVVRIKNNSYFPVSFDVKSLDGNGNVLLYSPSMDKDGVIHFAPKSEALLYVVQVRNKLKLPYKAVGGKEK